MKKTLLIILTFLICTSFVKADETREAVSLVSCDSAVSMWVKTSTGIKRIRLLMMDTSDGILNKEINDYACSVVKNAKSLEIEKDELSEEKNKYNEYLVYLYVDGTLLQESLISKGYAQVNYVYNDYKWSNKLCELQAGAINKNLGIWTYTDIKEEYCQSGIEIKNETKKEEKSEEKSYDYEYLKKMVLINSIIVVFLLVVMKRKKDEK